MTCRKLFDIKEVYIKDKSAFSGVLDSTAMRKMLASELVLEMKAEQGEIKHLNSTKRTTAKKFDLRKKGTVTFVRNLDTNLLSLFADVINAGLGEVSTGTAGAVTVTAGVGSVATPFLTTSTTNVTAGMLIAIPNFGLRKVESVVTDTSFVVDKAIDTAISTSTIFQSHKAINLSNPKGNCAKFFDVVVQGEDTSFVFVDCVVNIDLQLAYEGQQKITVKFTASKSYEDALLTLTNTVDETFATPVITNFDYSLFLGSDLNEVSFFPQNFDLGRAVTVEEQKYIGGTNNLQGFRNIVEIDPIFTFDRVDTLADVLLCDAYSCYQFEFGFYFPSLSFHEIDNSVANGNHESVVVKANVNDTSKNVYMFLPR